MHPFFRETSACLFPLIIKDVLSNDQPMKEWIRFGICVFSAVTVMYKAKI